MKFTLSLMLLLSASASFAANELYLNNLPSSSVITLKRDLIIPANSSSGVIGSIASKEKIGNEK